MLQDHSNYTPELQNKICKLYEDAAKLSRVLNLDACDQTSSLKNFRKYSQMFDNVDMDSDDDDIYEVLENEMANIENEESIKRYLTLNPTVWLMNNANREEASEILHDKQIGQFIVRKSSQEDTFALSIRVPDHLTKPVNHYLLIKSDIGYEAQGSNLFFPTLPSLLAHFCSYQSGGMPCLLKPPRIKRSEKSYLHQGQAYPPDPGLGGDGSAEMSYTSRNGQFQMERPPVLRQTNSVPASMDMQTNRGLPPPPPPPPPPASDTLIPKPGKNVHVISSRITPLPQPPSHLDYSNRSYMEPQHQLPRTSELEEQTDYASIEYDTPVHYQPNSCQNIAPHLPPRPYQQEVEYSDPLLSPDANEYDQPGRFLRNPLSLNRVRTTEDRHSSHAHLFQPPPIPPKTASMLIESRKALVQEEESLDSSQEVNRGIRYNSIRPNQAQGLVLPPPTSISHNHRDSLHASSDYLDMEPKETSLEMEKDIDLHVHHTIKHNNGVSQGEKSPTYVNVLFNTIATFKGVKQQEIPFEVGFDQQSVITVSQPPPPPPRSNGNFCKEEHYNMFMPVNRHPVTSALPPIKPLSVPQQNYNASNSQKDSFGERIISRPRPSPRRPSNESLLLIRRSNSVEILDTPSRKTEKPPLLPKPRINQGKGNVQHRRSSSSHECYNNHRIIHSDFSAKETLTRKRSAPSPTEGAQPKPILRGAKLPSGREREIRKVNFSGSTEVRETAKKIDDRVNNFGQQRFGRSRSPVSHFRPSHPPPPPPPTRRHSTNFSQPSMLLNKPASKSNLLGERDTLTTNGMTHPSNYMQPSFPSNSEVKVQTLDRASFFSKDEGRMKRWNLAEGSGEIFIKALKESPSIKRDFTNTTTALSSYGRSVKVLSKPQSENIANSDNLNNEIEKEKLHPEDVTNFKRNKNKKLRTPTQRVMMYIYRLNGRTHPMGNKIHSFNKAILKRQQGDGNVNIEKTLEQVRRFIDGVKKHLMTAKIEIITHKYRDQLNGNNTTEESTEMDELTDKLDMICENCLYNIILKPLYEHLIKHIRDYLNKNRGLEKISTNFDKGINRSPTYFGIRANLIPPNKATIKDMSNILQMLSDVFSPLRKLELLLDAVKLVYNSIRDEKHPGETNLSLGADDFLPIFIYTLVHSGMKEIEVEFLYTWNLLDPNLLSGEGGYYLTTLCTAIEVLKQTDFNSEGTSIDSAKL